MHRRRSRQIHGTPLLGAWLGDRVPGKTRAVTLGCLLMAAGHMAMASERLFLVALLMIVAGGASMRRLAADDEVGRPTGLAFNPAVSP